MTKRIATAALFLLVAIAAVAPIRSYDYFWHLAAGRWIVDHHAVPATDPLAVASVKTPWINGEWLYQVVLYATHVNDQATSLLNALLIAAIFTCGFVLAPALALLMMLIDVRRSIVALASTAALLVNPYGWRAVTAPFELSALAGSGEFVNAEWLPSDPKLFPLLYVTAAAVVIALLLA